MENFTWKTDYSHPDNDATMQEYLYEHLPSNLDVVAVDGSYAELRDNQTGKYFAAHASGDGDFYHHKIIFKKL